IAELAAQAREAPLPGQLAALAMWVGSGRRGDEEGDLSPADAVAAAAAAGVGADDFAYLWEYAIAADWLSYDDAGEDLVLPGEVAEAWVDDTDEDVRGAGGAGGGWGGGSGGGRPLSGGRDLRRRPRRAAGGGGRPGRHGRAGGRGR